MALPQAHKVRSSSNSDGICVFLGNQEFIKSAVILTRKLIKLLNLKCGTSVNLIDNESKIMIFVFRISSEFYVQEFPEFNKFPARFNKLYDIIIKGLYGGWVIGF